MGYSTEFQGTLQFKKDVTTDQIAALNCILGEDCRNHPEWDSKLFGYGLTYIDFEITSDFNGIAWNGAEKSYDMVEKVNLITHEMKKEFPEFSFEGELLAQGGDIEDRWKLKIDENGTAKRVDIVVEGMRVTCPHCEEEFIIENS